MSDDKPDYAAALGGNTGGNLSAGVNYNTAPTTQPVQNNAPAIDLGLTDQAQPLPIRDTTTENFMIDVIEASKSVPILVDFWAPWCQPCKQFTPILEAAVNASSGTVALVKMDIEAYPEIAGKMGIQSVPAVVAFVNGKPADAFQGVKSASEVKKFIEKVASSNGPSQLDGILEEAQSLMNAESYEEAGGLYSAILQQIPDNIEAAAGLGMALLKLGQLDSAKSVLENVEDYESHKEFASLISAIELEEQAGELDDLSQIAEKLAANPKDHQARFDLAIALNSSGQRDNAADHLLEIIKADRKWEDDGAKAQLIKFFEAWGPMDDATLTARRKLSSLLFS